MTTGEICYIGSVFDNVKFDFLGHGNCVTSGHMFQTDMLKYHTHVQFNFHCLDKNRLCKCIGVCGCVLRNRMKQIWQNLDSF